MDARQRIFPDAADTEPSRLWWFISCIWILMFSMVVLFILLAEYTRHAHLESRLVPATGQANTFLGTGIPPAAILPGLAGGIPEFIGRAPRVALPTMH